MDLDETDRATFAWTKAAAREEIAWICADCSQTFPGGMPDECPHGDADCTRILVRDKAAAAKD